MRLGSEGDGTWAEGGEPVPPTRKIRAWTVLWVVGLNLVFLGIAAYILGAHVFEVGLDPFLPDHLALLQLFLPVVGLFIAWRVLGRFLAQGWKFGETSLELDHSPVPLGGILAGRVRAGTEGHREPADGFVVRLSCYKRIVEWRTGGQGFHKEIRYELVWRDEKRIRSARSPDPSTVEIPVAFQLPGDAPATDRDSGDESALRRFFRSRREEVMWRVEVVASMPGVDFGEAFEVPVVEASAESAPARAETRVREAAEHEVEIRRPRSEGITVTRTPSRGLEISFRRPRHRKETWGMAVLIVVFGVGTHWAWTTDLSWHAPAAGLLITLLAVWLAYMVATQSSKITVDPDGITVEHRGSTEVPFGEVEDVRVELVKPAVKHCLSLPPDAIPAPWVLAVLRPASAVERGAGSRASEKLVGLLGDEARQAVKEHNTEIEARVWVARRLDDKPEADWLAATILEAVHRHAGRGEARTGLPE